ncbi:PstS family phosphate ABC transporter substrate-binding protein [Algicola sagamiensis]|uniref:PstS family phosphate ABC transporter substrate-binding protein n=1 Tax=Algicola sagamiensis TaxID=163869 RepID=UPI00036C0AE8|nr:phosphate ABC transporter substrate-binding protein [Algicola sagamiensis]
MIKLAVIGAMFVGLTLSESPSAFALDKSLPKYKKEQAITAKLSSSGSDTLDPVMKEWAAVLKKHHPGASISIKSAGSGTAPPALINKSAQFGPMSRKMKQKEVQQFEKKFGYKPVAIRVAIDAVGIYVHKSNSILGISIEQLDAMFSSTRKCGGSKAITSWGQIVKKGAIKNEKVHPFGRPKTSGTHGFFKKKALCKGKYASHVKEFLHPVDIIKAIDKDKGGIGYAGLGDIPPGNHKLIPVSDEDGRMIEPNLESIVTGKYPLGRYLYVYINKKPKTKIPAGEAEFLKIILSLEGQSHVEKHGLLPIPGRVAKRELRRLGLRARRE